MLAWAAWLKRFEASEPTSDALSTKLRRLFFLSNEPSPAGASAAVELPRDRRVASHMSSVLPPPPPALLMRANDAGADAGGVLGEVLLVVTSLKCECCRCHETGRVKADDFGLKAS